MEEEIEHSLKAAQKEFEEEPMKDFYENTLAGYPSRLRVRKIIRELGDLSGKTILDVGCEAGYVALKLLKSNPDKLYAIDIVDEALAECKINVKKAGYADKVVLKKAYLQKMPFKSKMFDVLVCTEVIEHAPHIEKGFAEMARVLKNGGILVLTFPNEPLRQKVYPIVKILGVNTDVEKDVTLFERDPEDIKNKLKKVGFKIAKYYRFPWYFPMTNFVVAEKAK